MSDSHQSHFDHHVLADVQSSLEPTLCSLCREILSDILYINLHNRDITALFLHRDRWKVAEREESTIVAETTHLTLSETKSSALSGCPLCMLIDDVMFAQYRNCTTPDDRLYFNFSLGLEVSCTTLRSRYGDSATFSVQAGRIRQTTTPSLTFDFIVDVDEVKEIILETTGDRLAYERIRVWLNECINSHETCVREDSMLPDRVLDVRGDDPVLLETNKRHGRWVSLSHCWGGKVALVTKKENISSHCQSIPLTSLPPTFRNAVQVCRSLEIPYLWIDSLCIIQDDRSDWEEQAQQMARIFADAVFVVVAKTAVNSNVGLFRRQSFSLTKSDDSLRSGALPGAISVKLSKSMAGFPILDTRGWCLQETLLAKASLSFYGPFTIWECRSNAYSDDLMGDMTPLTRLAYLRRDMLSRYDRPIHLWMTLVEEFTSRNLTCAEDRLAAVAGIADHLLRTFDLGRYAAGLFEVGLLSQLCWVIEPKGLGSRSSDHQFPSWSWAGNSEKVLYKTRISFGDLTPSDTVHPCSVRFLKTQPETLQATMTDATGTSLLLEGYLSRNAISISITNPDKPSLASAIPLTFPGLTPRALKNNNNNNPTIFPDSYIFLDHLPSPPPTTSIHAFVLVKVHGRPTSTDPSTLHSTGTVILLLEEVVRNNRACLLNLDRQTFKRVGLCDCDGEIVVGNDDQYAATTAPRSSPGWVKQEIILD